MRGLLLALMLAAGSPAMLHRVPIASVQGRLLKVIHTTDGDVAVYRVLDGCQVAFRGVPMQTVNLQTCGS